MSAHSPGPWWLDELDNAIRCERYGVRLATLEGAALLSDGRLMAASPDLLEALELLLSQYGCCCGIRGCNRCEHSDIAREAIQKARGEQ